MCIVATVKSIETNTSCEAAGQLIKTSGGSTATFDEAIKAAFDDMYQDTKMIREFRKINKTGIKRVSDKKSCTLRKEEHL